MSGAGGARLVVHADLTVRVTDPRGRSATVVVDDHDGAVRVRVAGPADLAVLFSSVPLARAGGRRLDDVVRGLRSGPGAEDPRWDQDVELFLGPRLMLSRRAGRWRPTPAAAVPVALAGVSALAVTGVAVAAVTLLVRRALRVSSWARPGGGATG